MSAARRRRLFIACALALGLLGGALGAEIFFRLYLWREFSAQIDRGPGESPRDPALVVHPADVIYPVRNRRVAYQFKPGVDCTMELNRLRFPLRTNSLGFRGAEMAKAKPPRTFRIAGLGDSSMWGWGVREEECYLRLLEEALNRAWSGEARFEAMNMAAMGYNSVIEVELFKQTGFGYGWDMAIVQYDLNDSATPSFIQTPKRFTRLDKLYLLDLPGYLFGSWTAPQRYISHRLEEFGSGIRAPQRGPLVTPPEEVRPEYADMIGWENVVAAYAELHRLCAEHGIAPLAIARPVRMMEEDPGAERDPDYDMAREMCDRLGIPMIDVFAPFRAHMLAHGLNTMDYWIVPNEDSHPNLLAHALMAKALFAPALAEAKKRFGDPPAGSDAGAAWLDERIRSLTEEQKARPRVPTKIAL